MGAGASKTLLTPDKASLAELILNELAQFEEDNPGLAASGGDFGPELFRKRVLLAAEDSKLKGKQVSIALANLSEADFAELSEMANDFIEKRQKIVKDINQDESNEKDEDNIDIDDNTSVLSYGDEDQVEPDNYTDEFDVTDDNNASPLVTERQDDAKLTLDIQKSNKVYNRIGDSSPTSDTSPAGNKGLEDSNSSIGSIENDDQIYQDDNNKTKSSQIHAPIHPGDDSDSPLKIDTPTTARESTLWDLNSSGESHDEGELFDPTGIIPLSIPKKSSIDTDIEKYKNKKLTDNTRSPTGYYQDYGQKIDDKNESLMDLQRLKIQSYETNAKLQREVEVLQMQLEKIEALEIEMGISAIKAGNKPVNQHSNPLSLPNNKFSYQNNIENHNNHQNYYYQNSQYSLKNSYNNNVNVSIETIQNSINKSGIVSTDVFPIKKQYSNNNDRGNKNKKNNSDSYIDIEVENDNLESTCISDISDISNFGDNSYNNTNPRIVNNKKQNPNGIRRGVYNYSESKQHEYNIADEMKYLRNHNSSQAKSASSSGNGIEGVGGTVAGRSNYNNENDPYSVIEINDNDYNEYNIKSQNKIIKKTVIKDVFESKDSAYNKDMNEINNLTSETDNVVNSSIDEETAPVRKQRSKNILKNLNRRRRHTIDTNEQQGDSLTEDEAYNSSSNANITDDEVPSYSFAHGSDRGSRKNAPNGQKKDGKRAPRQRQSLETLDSIDSNINRNNSNLRINVNAEQLPINNIDDKARRRKPNRIIKKKDDQIGDESITNVSLKNDENKDDQPPEKEKLWTRALDIRWGEVNLLLRKKICSEADIQYTVAAAEAGLMFTDQLNSVAKSLNVLRGTLSRWLLPYDNNTRIEEQCSTPHSVVEAIPEALKGKITERQIHYLVAGANSVRKLVRIKIADDNDLDQARLALKTAVDFFRRLSEDSSKHNITSWELLQMEE